MFASGCTEEQIVAVLRQGGSSCRPWGRHEESPLAGHDVRRPARIFRKGVLSAPSDGKARRLFAGWRDALSHSLLGARLRVKLASANWRRHAEHQSRGS